MSALRSRVLEIEESFPFFIKNFVKCVIWKWKGADNGTEYEIKMISKECNVRLLKIGVHLTQCIPRDLRVILMKE